MSELDDTVKRNLDLRSSKSEQLLKELNAEYEDLTKLFEEKRSKALADRLKNENEYLRHQIAVKKEELIKLELQHKVPQISTTSNKPTKGPESVKPVNENDNLKKEVPSKGQEIKQTSEPEKQKEKPQKKTEKKPQPASAASAPVDVSRLDFRVGRIISAKKHPDADSLYVEDVDVGEGKTRTVVSGLVKYVPIDQMQNRLAVLLCNLKPAKMRGVTSEAMVMCASTPEKVEILNPPAGSVPGDLVEVEGYQRNPDAVLNPKNKVFEGVAPDLMTNEEGIATFKGIPWTIAGKGKVTAPSLKGSPIK